MNEDFESLENVKNLFTIDNEFIIICKENETVAF